MMEVDINCPYKDEECPKVKSIKAEIKDINWKLNALIMVVVLLHGAELLALMGMR